MANLKMETQPEQRQVLSYFLAITDWIP